MLAPPATAATAFPLTGVLDSSFKEPCRSEVVRPEICYRIIHTPIVGLHSEIVCTRFPFQWYTSEQYAERES